MIGTEINTYRTLRIRQLRAQITALQHELDLLQGEQPKPVPEATTFAIAGERVSEPRAPKRPTLRKTNDNET